MTTTLLPAVRTHQPAQRDKLHVVHGVLSLEPGGLERVVVDLVLDGIDRGHRVSVICVERRGRLAPLVEDAGGDVHCLDKPLGRCPGTIAEAESLLVQHAPDVVHTHQIGALWYLGQAARRLGIPVVHTEHSNHIDHCRHWLGKFRAWLLWRQAARLADSLCCVSQDIASAMHRWRAVPSGKVDVVVNGIDPRIYQGPSTATLVRAALGIPSGVMVIGTVGRLVEVKRHDLLLRSFADLHRQSRHAGHWLLVVGDGPERRRLERLAVELGVAERTVFAGYQSKPQRYLQAMDLFVLTSRHEGLPLAILEAWASGLAVVASAVGGIPRMIRHGANGFLFESGDRRALTDTLLGLLDTPSWLGYLGRQGRQEVEHRYSLQRMADDYEGRYRTLISHEARVHA